MKKLKSAILSISTALGSAAVLYACIPLAPVIVMMAVISTHETGHFAIGSFTGADANLPIFIPFGFFVLGLTRIKKVQDEFKSAVAIAGPMSGAAAALGVMLLALWVGNIPLAVAATTALVYEVWSGTLGSDGRRFRTAKRG
jgi:hypothetical protein